MSDIAKIDYTPLAADNQIHRTAFERYGGRRIIGIVREVIGMRLSTSDTDALWRAFAVANGWQVEEVQDLTLIPLSLMYGHIEYGRRRSCSPAVKADLCGIQAGILVYSSVVYGRACSVTVARVPLPKALPHILLRAKGEVSMLAADIGDHEKLRLEGDFDNYFTLQVKKGQEINALEIITPDIMQTLIGYSQREDIEIEDNGLYFIVDGDARNVAAIRQLIESVAHLSPQIIEYVDQTTIPAPHQSAAGQ